ncbi:MAG: exo-alpha-sialidase [candidate division Zixibacteria bacterium]
MYKITILITAFMVFAPALAQNTYVYPNKKLADEGLLEYRRYTLEEARAYDRGGSFDPYLPLDWGAERRLTEQDNVYRARVETAGDSLFVAYQTLSARGTYFINSLNAGENWEPFITLEDTTRVLFHLWPEIMKNGSELMIGLGVQEQGEGNSLYYYRSTDTGTTWSDMTRILPNTSWDYNYFASFNNVNNKVFASYRNSVRDSIYVIKSMNWGDTWNGRGVNVAYLNSTPQPMAVRASGNDVHLVWVNEEGTVSCRYSRSTNSGQTWSEEIDIAQDSLGAQRAFVAVQDTHVVISWNGFKYSPYGFTGDLFIKQSFDSGETWGEEQVLTDLHKVWMGTVYIKDSLIVATWQDTRFENGNNEVMAIFSSDYGQTWIEEERLSNANYDSHAPIACMTDNKIHVLWGDMRLSAPGLYYCVNDPLTGIENKETSTPTNIYIESYPNPFNANTIITYIGIEGSDIQIYNITGQLIKSIKTTGKEGVFIWDATDDTEQPVSSGLYFIRAKTSQGYTSKKILYLR